MSSRSEPLDLEKELAILFSKKKKLLAKIDDVDTEIIGLKEELRRQKEEKA